MIVTTYTCDKCGHEQEEPEQMWEIGIVAREQTIKHSNYINTPRECALWCHSCVVKFGLLPRPKDTSKPNPIPTFEDIIREIIQEEIVDTTP